MICKRIHVCVYPRHLISHQVVSSICYLLPPIPIFGLTMNLPLSNSRMPFEYWFEVAVHRQVDMVDEFAALSLTGLGRGAVK